MPCLSSLFIIRDFIHQLDQIKMKINKGRRGKRNIQLPYELIIEILLRLPVKSLIRFKCVCKSWLSLISDPHFATSHFDLTTCAHIHRLIFIAKMHVSKTRAIDFQVSLNDAVATTVSLNLNFMLPQSYLSLQIGGSCRGFLFLHCHQNIYLWNPSTGIHKQIHWSPTVSDVDTKFYTYLYGFGYDPSTDDYLVVLGSYDEMITDALTHLEFFSQRANTWKEIVGAHFPYMRTFNNPKVGTLFNGAIHWLACRANTSVNVIVAFDLTERRISEITLPDFCNFYHDLVACYDLFVFRGFMSLWAMECDVVEIWVMKEYGVYSSWTKTLVLSIWYFSPICSTNCGDIVGSDGRGGLVKYNDNGELLEHRSYCNRPSGSQVTFYTESLLPLPLPRDTQQA